ncbi:MAG: cytochrome C peroxidase [Verrucomicrobia bacterium]|nr:cytochrome C peroxidase [Verrucomicrobiota bacterium]
MIWRTSIPLLLIAVVLPLRAAEEESVRIAISHTVDGNPLRLDSLRYELASGERYSISRLSYLISEVAFETETGEWVSAGDAVGYFDVSKRLLDFDCQLPEQSYRAMRFSIGLVPETNHSDPAGYPAKHSLNPDHNQLHWTWATGYIFMAVEGRFYDQDKQLNGYVYHFANDVNRVIVNLPIQLMHSNNTLIELVFDLSVLFEFPSAISFISDGNSTHSHEGDIITGKLKQNLPAAFRVQRIKQTISTEEVAPPEPIDMPSEFTPFAFKMSRNFSRPDLPVDNPLIEERVELGEKLFFDTRLSRNNSISCASCHQPEKAFSDSNPQSQGVSDKRTRRHSMPLFNLAWKREFFWDGRVNALRDQVFHPLQHPDEMGSNIEELIVRLSGDPNYSNRFARAFTPGGISREHIGLALESYLLTLVSYHSKFDDAMAGKALLTKEEKRGFELFMTEYEPRSGRYGADCFHCHGGALFTDNQFHNNGLTQGSDKGRGEFTGRESDQYKFSTPSSRNVALTGPYMHDGSMATLDEVIRHYSEGIQLSDTLDPNLAKHPMTGIQLSESDQKAMVSFLETLSDPLYLNN